MTAIRRLSTVTATQIEALCAVQLARQLCGVIPGYALLPRGGLWVTIYFYRVLSD